MKKKCIGKDISVKERASNIYICERAAVCYTYETNEKKQVVLKHVSHARKNFFFPTIERVEKSPSCMHIHLYVCIV